MSRRRFGTTRRDVKRGRVLLLFFNGWRFKDRFPFFSVIEDDIMVDEKGLDIIRSYDEDEE